MKAQLICVKCLEQSLAHTNGSYYYSLMLPHQLMNKSYGRTLYVPMLYSIYAYVLCIYMYIQECSQATFIKHLVYLTPLF